MTAAPKKYLGSFFWVTIFYSVMVLISLLFIVIPVMSVDVSCAAATQEIFVFITREQGECQGVLGRPGGISCRGEKDVRNWL